MLPNERKKLRSTLLNKRALLTVNQQQHASRVIFQRLTKYLVFLRSKRIAFYFANKLEIDPSLLLEQALDMGKECYLPILHPISHNKMWFGRYQLGDTLKKNHFGIMEPSIELTVLAAPWSLDLVITPLVGFDEQGNRLGMGGGYYDRTFSFRQHHVRTKPKLLGLAYDFQRLPKIDAQKWDIPLDMVITETNTYHFD